jgi:tRNA-2-methylthio-N6-dimethylallyladenosine synthase
MNVHDSEKVENLLLHHGYVAARDAGEADLLIVNTCSIREKAEHRLYSDLGVLRSWKEALPGRVLGVGGCVAQQEGDALLLRFPQVDFVFGTHNLRLVPALALAASQGARSVRTEERRNLDRFALPMAHPEFAPKNPGRAYLTVMEGCDMFCSFCIVPTTRGREISRPAEDILREAEILARRGVREFVLLGQTVNAYGRHEAKRKGTKTGGTLPFAELLRRLADLPGVARLRYTSPHPLFFGPELVAAHRDLEPLCPHVHLPAQSGSDSVLSAMRRRYRRSDYLALVEGLREARADLVLSTDLIVGFPGETDEDFEETLTLVREVGFVDSYSFKYSPRPGTQAEGREATDGVPEAVKQARLETLQALQKTLTLKAYRARVGTRTEILLEGESRRGGQLTGRDPYHRVVNLAGKGPFGFLPGSLVPVEIVEATPHSLLAEPLPATCD